MIWAIFFLVVIGFLVLTKAILLPFVVAFITAYFLDPVVDHIESKGLSRPVATLVITLLFFIVMILLALLLLPILYEQLLLFMHQIPNYITYIQNELLPKIAFIIDQVDPDAVAKAKASLSDFSATILKIAARLVKEVLQSGIAMLNLLSLLFITPVVTFYLIRDWDAMIAKIDSWVPKLYKKDVRTQCKLIDQALAGYIRGQTNVCILLGLFYAVCLVAIGLEFGLFIGFITGLLCFIPYVGVLVGMAVGLMVAFFQFGDVLHISLVLAVFLVGQFLEGNFIAPKLVGDRVGLHPVWIIFGLLAGAALFGFVGVLIAVPVTAIGGVVIRYMLGKYLQSNAFQSSRKKQKV